MGLVGKKIGILIESDFYEKEIFYYEHRFAEEDVRPRRPRVRRAGQQGDGHERNDTHDEEASAPVARAASARRLRRACTADRPRVSDHAMAP